MRGLWVELPSKRMHLRGTFTIRMHSPDPADPPGADIVIDFLEPPPWAAIADRVKELVDRGLLYSTIAAELKCPRSWPAKAMAFWHEQRHLKVPDGRSERHRLPPDAETVERQNRAKTLWDGGLLIHEIAEKLGCCRDTASALLRAWHTSRGLEAPRGTVRRKTPTRKSTQGDDPECFNRGHG